MNIDIEGFESRVVVLPPKAGNYDGLQAVAGKVLYRRQPRTGSGEEKSALVYYDLEEREEKTVAGSVDGFEVTADGKKVLVVSDKKYAIVDVKADQKLDKAMRTGEMEALVDPAAEWRQMFADAYRVERDYFYDPTLHGVDWKATRERYARLIDASVTRWDVNFVLGEFIAELNASHTYNGGGDLETAPARGAGMLGVDWEVAEGAYRIKRIVAGGPWDADVRSPLSQPGVEVKAGDYVLAVNGTPLDIGRDPWAAFEGLADAAVVLTVNGKPTADGARQVLVKCLPNETELRFREWIEQRRKRVDEATGGRAGYVYVQSTGVDAQSELVRQFMAQWRKDGLVVDERFNSGGQIPDRFIELLNRPMLAYWAVRDGAVVAVAAGGAPRPEGDADQRLERIGRRRVPVLLPRSRPRAAHRHADVGRPDRHQRIARRWSTAATSPCRRSGCTTCAAGGSPKATASIRTSRSTKIRRSWPRASTRSSNAPSRKCCSASRTRSRSCRGRRTSAGRHLRRPTAAGSRASDTARRRNHPRITRIYGIPWTPEPARPAA